MLHGSTAASVLTVSSARRCPTDEFQCALSKARPVAAMKTRANKRPVLAYSEYSTSKTYSEVLRLDVRDPLSEFKHASWRIILELLFDFTLIESGSTELRQTTIIT